MIETNEMSNLNRKKETAIEKTSAKKKNAFSSSIEDLVFRKNTNSYNRTKS
jgi:hypothetical protein